MTVNSIMSVELSDKIRMPENVESQVEVARLLALQRYDVLDSAAEYCFDHITNAVKLALDVPMAAISMMDGNRLWFKSKIGFDVAEVPRYTALCNHTIGQNSTMIIEDTTRDSRIAKSPAVSGVLSLRSYIGVPLTTPDGHNIGALCVGDTKPRTFEHQKIELMEHLAEVVIHELELRQQAKRDQLTGALTRSGFAVEVQKAIALFNRQAIKSTLVLFDVDLNNILTLCAANPSSELSGNALLRTIIQALSARLDPSNHVGRMGGTQFAVLLTATTEAEARFFTRELLEKMDNSGAGAFLDVGFSEISADIGICSDWLKSANIDLGATKSLGCCSRHSQTASLSAG